jgi:hypothetical protein
MDNDLERLTPEQKLFYVYLITNPKVSQLGIYEFSERHASFELGFTTDVIIVMLRKFESMGKIVWNQETREVCLVNFWRYNGSTSPKVLAHCKKVFSTIKDKSLIEHLKDAESLLEALKYSMDTVSQKEEELKEEEELKLKEEEEATTTLQDLLNFCYTVWPNGKKKEPLVLLRQFDDETKKLLLARIPEIKENLQAKINAGQIGPNQNLFFWLKNCDWQEEPRDDQKQDFSNVSW